MKELRNVLPNRYYRAGPMRCSDESLKELGKPVIPHRGGDFHETYMGVVKKIGQVLETKGRVVPVVASGTGGNEFMISNLILKKDKVLCIVNGFFSERLHLQVKYYTSFSPFIRISWGDSISPEQLDEYLLRYQPDIVVLVSNETSTGAWLNIKELSRVCHKHNCMILVDHISGVGNTYKMDEWGIDATSLTTHESLAAPPGLAFVAFSDRALQKASGIHKNNEYFTLARYLKFQDARGEPPFTVPTNLMKGLLLNLDKILGIGIGVYDMKCMSIGEHFRNEIKELGYTIFTNPSSYSATVSAIWSKGSSLEFVKEMRQKFGVSFAEGNGTYRDSVFRIGHAGVTEMEDIDFLLECFRKLEK